MFYGGKYMVLWKERKEDGQDALMRSFDTTIESKSYIQGFVDAIIEFTDERVNEEKLIQEFKIDEIK
tara:strand:+ start:2154 stop:2354 length:201 start_codon:yes stop_codon:yes gene_type:complete